MKVYKLTMPDGTNYFATTLKHFNEEKLKELEVTEVEMTEEEYQSIPATNDQYGIFLHPNE